MEELLNSIQSPVNGQDQIRTLAAQLDAGNIPSESSPATTTEDNVEPEAHRLAAKFAEIARRNQALRNKQRETVAPLKEKDAELEKLRAEVERLKKYDDINDPMELLKAKGMTYEQLIEKNLNPESFDSKSELQKVREELASFKKALEDEKKSGLEKQKETAISEYQAHLVKYVDNSGEKYELIKAFGSHQDVYDVIEQTYNRTGKVISDEEACDLVEKFLEERLDPLSKINKLRNRITPVKEDLQQRDLIREPSTLTNQLTPQSTAIKKGQLSEEEELRRAAQFVKWNS